MIGEIDSPMSVGEQSGIFSCLTGVSPW